MRARVVAALPALGLAVGVAGCTAAGAAPPRTDHPHHARTGSRAVGASRPVAQATATEPPTSTTTSTPTTSTTTTTTLPPPAPGLVAGRVTVVGDSVTVDAQPALQSDIAQCVVDAQVGEQWETGVSVLGELKAEGQLGWMVVVALGTNGPVTSGEFAQMMSTLSGTSRVVVVTNHAPDSWEEQNNALFRSELAHYPTLRIADWDTAARDNPSWLYSDGTHMPIGGTGAQAFAQLVKAQL